MSRTYELRRDGLKPTHHSRIYLLVRVPHRLVQVEERLLSHHLELPALVVVDVSLHARLFLETVRHLPLNSRPACSALGGSREWPAHPS